MTGVTIAWFFYSSVNLGTVPFNVQGISDTAPGERAGYIVNDGSAWGQQAR
jgi:hypothetical protein